MGAVSKAKKAAQTVKARKRQSRLRKNRTLSLDHDNFEKLQGYCRKNKISVSEVVDDLIAAFLEES